MNTKCDHLENIYRFYDGTMGGIVMAKDLNEAIKRTKEYFNMLGGYDYSDEKLIVWSIIDDDDFLGNCPYACRVS